MEVKIWLSRDSRSGADYRLWLGEPAWIEGDETFKHFTGENVPATFLCAVPDQIIVLAGVDLDIGDCAVVDEIRFPMNFRTALKLHQDPGSGDKKGNDPSKS